MKSREELAWDLFARNRGRIYDESTDELAKWSLDCADEFLRVARATTQPEHTSERLLAEQALDMQLVAKLARVECQRDAAIVRAEAAERDCFRLTELLKQELGRPAT